MKLEDVNNGRNWLRGILELSVFTTFFVNIKLFQNKMVKFFLKVEGARLSLPARME